MKLYHRKAYVDKERKNVHKWLETALTWWNDFPVRLCSLRALLHASQMISLSSSIAARIPKQDSKSFVYALAFWNGLNCDFFLHNKQPNFDFSTPITLVIKRKKQVDYCYPKRISREDRHSFVSVLHFGYLMDAMDANARSWRIPAVFQIKTPSAKHAQTKCLYARQKLIDQ